MSELLAKLRDEPTFINPHIRMCAVITAVTRQWGEAGEQVLRTAYRSLGHMTGEYMIQTGVVRRGADLETYGRVSEQIMDICGMHGWARLTDARPVHATRVPRCADYCSAYAAIDAPLDLCSIPFEWDNGCLDRINPGLEIWPEGCVNAGGEECIYTIRPRFPTPPPVKDGAHQQEPAAALAVRDAPTWTNPQAGLYAIISRSITAFGEAGWRAVESALLGLGRRSGHALLTAGSARAASSPAEAAELMGVLGVAAGYVDWSVDVDDAGCARLVRHRNPFQPVFDHFDSPPDVQWLVAAWDRGWLEIVAPRLVLEMEADSRRHATTDTYAFTPIGA